MWSLRFRQQCYPGSMNVELEKDVTMINELSTEACPSDQYGTEERRRSAGLVDRYDLAFGDGMYVL